MEQGRGQCGGFSRQGTAPAAPGCMTHSGLIRGGDQAPDSHSPEKPLGTASPRGALKPERWYITDSLGDPSKFLPLFRPWSPLLSLKKQMASHSSILAGKVPWTEVLGGVLSMGTQLRDRARA